MSWQEGSDSIATAEKETPSRDGAAAVDGHGKQVAAAVYDSPVSWSRILGSTGLWS